MWTWKCWNLLLWGYIVCVCTDRRCLMFFVRVAQVADTVFRSAPSVFDHMYILWSSSMLLNKPEKVKKCICTPCRGYVSCCRSCACINQIPRISNWSLYKTLTTGRLETSVHRFGSSYLSHRCSLQLIWMTGSLVLPCFIISLSGDLATVLWQKGWVCACQEGRWKWMVPSGIETQSFRSTHIVMMTCDGYHSICFIARKVPNACQDMVSADLDRADPGCGRISLVTEHKLLICENVCRKPLKNLATFGTVLQRHTFEWFKWSNIWFNWLI